MNHFSYSAPHAAEALLALLLLLPACDSDPARDDEDALHGGLLATLTVEGEAFKVWITNPQTIQQILDLRDGKSQASIPNGPLRAGSGPGAHNEPWSWHLDPQATEMAENTIEVCSARPSFVEADLDEWINNVGQYCPWGATLVQVEDLR
jgi:TusA-related sulfurtransferase